MEETLKILESVNLFYSQSFNQLVVITVAVLTFAGVVMPIIISLYQKRLFRIEHEEIKISLKSELNSELDRAIEKLNNEYIEKESKYLLQIQDLNNIIEKKFSSAISGSLQIQGNIHLKEENFLLAFHSLVRAANGYIKADNERNLKRTLRLIQTKCLPRLCSDDLKKDNTFSDDFEELVSELDKFNANDRYSDELRRLKIEFKKANIRAFDD